MVQASRRAVAHYPSKHGSARNIHHVGSFQDGFVQQILFPVITFIYEDPNHLSRAFQLFVFHGLVSGFGCFPLNDQLWTPAFYKLTRTTSEITAGIEINDLKVCRVRGRIISNLSMNLCQVKIG